MIDLSTVGSVAILAVLTIFCRIGGCLLIMPGFSSTHVPVRVRLFLALALTLAISPLLLDQVSARIGNGDPGTMLTLVAVETTTGIVIGLLGRLFFMALETIAVAAAQAIGISALPGFSVEDNEQIPTLATLVTLTATVLIFVSDQHWELLRGLVDSYTTIPPGEGIGAQAQLVQIADQISSAFLVALRVGSPFLLYSVVVNFAVAIIGKLTPQIPAYFIALPIIVAGGLFLLFDSIKDFMAGFMSAFGTWLVHG